MAGSGDVLAGIIAGLTAKMKDIPSAVRLGVFLHGAAGDTGRGAVIADDLPALAAAAAAYHTWW
jgi:NAD(P)H-hydrate repair Nnr-like enzyme with NAD(P)H-hydrate dehydratase domain